MTGPVTISSDLITAILEGVALPPQARARLLAAAGVAPEALVPVDGRVPIAVLAAVWGEVVRVTGDPTIGLHIGAAIPAERFGLAVHAAQNSRDFREMLARFVRYAGLINELIVCDLEETPTRASFVMRFERDEWDLERPAVDIAFAALHTWAARWVGSPYCLQEVRFTHSLASAREAYERMFGRPITLGAARNELIFAASGLGAQLPGSPGLGRILEHYASVELANLPARGELAARIRQILRARLQAGQRIELQQVADALAMTTRQLQRKLQAASTRFSALLEDARRSLAPGLLAQPDANVEQVSVRLGYAEPTTFIRAFKKWYGVTPGAHRRRAAR